MPIGFNLQKIFNEIIAGASLKILFATKKEYESMRSSLLRKYKDYVGLLDSLGGPNHLEGKFLRCVWKSEDVSGTFYLAEEAKRQNNPAKTYNVKIEL